MLKNNHDEISDIEIFGMRLKAARKNSGYTQRELAKQLNVSSVAISCWESGKVFPNKKRRKMIEKILSTELFDKVYIKNYYENVDFIKEMIFFSKKMSQIDKELVRMFARDVFHFHSKNTPNVID